MYKFLLPLFALALLLVSCAPSSTGPQDTPNGAASSASSSLSFSFDGKILSGKHTVTLKTSKGDIELELDADAAPKTVTNFITLAKNGYYDHLTFHRVIPSFMIQGGDPNGDGTGGRSIFGPTFEDEINANSYGLDRKTVEQAAAGAPVPPEVAKMTLKQYYERPCTAGASQCGYTYNDSLTSLPLKRGAVAMANRGANTNGSQFFIIQGAETPWLNGQHTVFGNVVKGLDILDAIVNVPRDTNDKPLEPVTFTVEVEDAAASASSR